MQGKHLKHRRCNIKNEDELPQMNSTRSWAECFFHFSTQFYCKVFGWVAFWFMKSLLTKTNRGLKESEP